MSFLYFTAGVLSIFIGFLTDMFIFILMGICFIFTGIAYLYTYGLEQVEYKNIAYRKKKKNLDNTQVFKKIE